MLVTLLNGATTLGPGVAVQKVEVPTVQMVYSGNYAAPWPQVVIEGSLDGTNFGTVATLNATSASCSVIANVAGKYPYMRANVTSLAPGGGTYTVYSFD